MQPVYNNQPATFVSLEIAKERNRELRDKIYDALTGHVFGMATHVDPITKGGIIHIGHGERSREKIIAFMHEHGLLSQNASNQYCYKDVPIEFEASGPAYICNPDGSCESSPTNACNITYATTMERSDEILKKLLKLDEVSTITPQIDPETNSGMIRIGVLEGNLEKVLSVMHEYGLLSQNSSNQYFYKDVPIKFEVEDEVDSGFKLHSVF